MSSPFFLSHFAVGLEKAGIAGLLKNKETRL
jgi:hypothetical protein